MPRNTEQPEDEVILNDDSIDGIPPKKWRVSWRKSSLPGILVSERGDVWDCVNGKHPPLFKVDTGHLVIVVKDGESYKREYISKLVYEAFFGKLMDGLFVGHRDNVNSNDDITNLVAMSLTGNGRPINVYKNGKVFKTYPSGAEYAREIGVSVSQVLRYLDGTIKNSTLIHDEIGYADGSARRTQDRLKSDNPDITVARPFRRHKTNNQTVEVVRNGKVIKTFPSVKECAKGMDLSYLTVLNKLKGRGASNPYKKVDEIRYAKKGEVNE